VEAAQLEIDFNQELHEKWERALKLEEGVLKASGRDIFCVGWDRKHREIS
jgi:hypothetical protein